MRNLFIVLSLVSQVACASNSIVVKDNAEFALTLSQTNYNRLWIKNDKIVDFAFPDNTLALKRDAQDGSVYITLGRADPFTLFLTTELGRHFSVTVTGEASLGKTIELIPREAVVATAIPSKKTVQPPQLIPDDMMSLMTHMERHQPITGFKVTHQNKSAERWQGGLTLLPKESWEGDHLKGEIIAVYNMSKKPMELSESWFARDGVKVIKLSQHSLAPKEHTLLYRVTGVLHG